LQAELMSQLFGTPPAGLPAHPLDCEVSDAGRHAVCRSAGAIYGFDRHTGTVTRIGLGTAPDISGDGQHVVFVRGGRMGDGTAAEIFVWSRATAALERVDGPDSGLSSDVQRLSGSLTPAISSDGRWIAFSSDAPGPPNNDAPRERGLFIRDRDRGTTTRVDVPLPDVEREAPGALAVSPDGRYVVATAWSTTQPEAPDFHVIRYDSRERTGRVLTAGQDAEPTRRRLAVADTGHVALALRAPTGRASWRSPVPVPRSQYFVGMARRSRSVARHSRSRPTGDG
jgi:hypothetical protein